MITIFTPTYNRAYIIQRLYESLLEQTNKDFEWIVVDDGSIDATEEIIKQWKLENRIGIRYYRQENQGKMIAHNKGVKEANGELFVCVDSDDYLEKDAIETIIETWKQIENNKCIGMVCPKVTENQKEIETLMPKGIEYSTLMDLYENYGFSGDTMLIYKTGVIKKYEFPKIEGEKFIPETYLYDKLDLEGKMYLLNKKLYICEYLPDGYTANVRKLMKDNPKGYILYARQRMQVAKNFKTKLRANMQYILGNWLAHNKGYIKKSVNPILTSILIPFASIVYRKRYRKI